jgi:hypothetical protein
MTVQNWPPRRQAADPEAVRDQRRSTPVARAPMPGRRAEARISCDHCNVEALPGGTSYSAGDPRWAAPAPQDTDTKALHTWHWSHAREPLADRPHEFVELAVGSKHRAFDLKRTATVLDLELALLAASRDHIAHLSVGDLDVAL